GRRQAGAGFSPCADRRETLAIDKPKERIIEKALPGRAAWQGFFSVAKYEQGAVYFPRSNCI
ncbi:hypothetical protein, partial [Alcaligenes faecalis]|uniref:hypothetical protein n=1 Tax=Alcaligenes faecalis TaxID=511 RepID=UPI001E328CBD